MALLFIAACEVGDGRDDEVVVEDDDSIALPDDGSDSDETLPYTNYSCRGTGMVYVGDSLYNSSQHTLYNSSWCASDGGLWLLAAWQCEVACGCDKDASYRCFGKWSVGPPDGSYFAYRGVHEWNCENICNH